MAKNIGVRFNEITKRVEADWTNGPNERITVADLRRSLQHRQPITLRGLRGYVRKLEWEDGSGKSWNVDFYITDTVPVGCSNTCTLWIRTTDAERRAA
jgi:hypothetical protein